VTDTPLFHIGILVHDIGKAMTNFSTALGVTFNEPGLARLSRLEDPDPHPLDFPVTFSREGSVRLELLEARGTGIFSPERGEGVHHLAVWSKNVGAKMADLARVGFDSEARVVLPGGDLQCWFSKPSQLHGVSIEYIDEADRGKLDAFMNHGPSEVGFDF
jgi:hypothetical protein